MSGRTFFVILLIINFLIAILYFLWSRFYKKEKRGDSTIRFAIMLLCPAAAECIFFFSWLYFRVFFHREADLDDVVFSKEREKTYRKADEEEESNLVPLEEALAVTDRSGTRVLMMDVIRRDISGTLGTIALSLDSDDSEVSHYGASILTSALSDFRRQAEELYGEIQKGEEEGAPEETLVSAGHELIEDLDQVLKQHVLPRQEQEEYVGLMDRTADFVEKHAPLTPEELEKLCGRSLEIGDVETCRKRAGESAALYPDTLSSYTSFLKLYYQTGEREAFFDTLHALKASDISIDHDTLEVIRLFEEPSG